MTIGKGPVTEHDLAKLEKSILAHGWTVLEQGPIAPSRSRRVNRSGYVVAVNSPDGASFAGEGPTRPDALRMAARLAGLLVGDWTEGS